MQPEDEINFRDLTILGRLGVLVLKMPVDEEQQKVYNIMGAMLFAAEHPSIVKDALEGYTPIEVRNLAYDWFSALSS